MQPAIRYLVAAIVGGALTACACAAVDYISRREIASQVTPQPTSAVTAAQFAEMQELHDLLGEKDEMQLRETFDLPYMLLRNMDILQIKVGFIHAGKWRDFLTQHYGEGNGDAILWEKPGVVTRGPNGMHLNPGPLDVILIVTTVKYQQSKKRLIQLSNSALIPVHIKAKLIDLDRLIDADVNIMMQVLDGKLHENENYILQYKNVKSPYYGGVVSEYARRFRPLKPLSDDIVAAIGNRWQTNR